nr:MAG TPA: hypothetical protein [Caudoviricetes sp.]
MIGLGVSIHALLAESDWMNSKSSRIRTRFQSTPSLRRATPADLVGHIQERGFNPRPPCGERQYSLE